METCPAANPDHSPNKPKPCPEVGSKARSAHREPIVGAAPSRRMRASYPAKSQTLRPGVGPPTESKAQKQTKAPTARSDLLFLWEPRPRGECGLPTQPRGKSFAPGSGLPQNQKLKSSKAQKLKSSKAQKLKSSKAKRQPKRPPPAVTCFSVGGAPSRRMRAIARYPSQTTSRRGSPELKTYQPSSAQGPPRSTLLSETEIEALLTNSSYRPNRALSPREDDFAHHLAPGNMPKSHVDRPYDS